MTENIKYFNFRGKTYPVRLCPDGFWRDEWNCIYALRDDTFTLDKTNRAGIWPFVIPLLPLDHPVNEAAGPHDFKYSCPVYQAFHTRLEADKDLRRDEKLMNKGSWWRVVSEPFFKLARWFGRGAWENKKTNN
jgi:hypothetical protein